jgi:phage portal protein BeeE
MKTLTIPHGGNGHAPHVKSLSLVNPADWGLSFTGETAALISVGEAYRDVGWFRSAVDTRANAVSSTPWDISKGENVVWSHGDPPPDELAWISDFTDILNLTELSLVIDGNAWFLKVEQGRGVERLQYFAPSTMEPVATRSGVKAWERKVEGSTVMLDPDQVLHVWVKSPFQEQPAKKGDRMSEARAALAHASVLKALDDFTTSDLKSGLIKPVLVRVPVGTPEAEKNRITAWVKEKFAGKNKGGKFGIAELGGLEIDVMGGNINELAAEDLVRIHRNGIATALRVKHSMLQSMEAANRSVSEQDVRSFWDNTVIPRLRLIQAGFNQQLFEPQGYTLMFRPERLEAFQAAELAKAEQVSRLWETGLTTRNEARATIEGLDEIEGPEGDEYFVAPSPIAVSTTGQRRAKVRPFRAA